MSVNVKWRPPKGPLPFTTELHKHMGPGPHPSGSPQSVHGRKGVGGSSAFSPYRNSEFFSEVTEVEAADFYEGFAEARQGKYGAFLSDFSVDDFSQSNIRTFSAYGGTVGAALTDHGDGRIEAGSLYALPGAPSGAGRDMLRFLIREQGANWLNNFDGPLTEFYLTEGFVVETRDSWNEEYAPPDWNRELFGTPDYVTMGLPDRLEKLYDTRAGTRPEGTRLGRNAREARRRLLGDARRLPGGPVGVGEGDGDDRRGRGPGLIKHYGPGDHPGTGTPQTVHKPVESASGKHKGTITDTDPVDETFGPYGDVEADVRSIFEATLELEGDSDLGPITAEVTEIDPRPGMNGTEVMVHGILTDDGGNEIGNFKRLLKPGGKVYNSGFNVIHSGRGVGTMFLSHWEDELAAAGFTEMSVSAVATGRYAWAIAGYTWRGDQGEHAWFDEVKSLIHLHDSDPEPRFAPKLILTKYSDPEHDASWQELEILIEDWEDTGQAPAPIDFALIGSNRPVEGSHFGKDLMLSVENWGGKKELKIRKGLDQIADIWSRWAKTNPAAVENDNPEFLAELRAVYGDVYEGGEPVEKSGVLTPGFGSKRKRRNQLVQRLKSTRRYRPPVKGGAKKKRRSRLANNLIRRRKGGKRF